MKRAKIDETKQTKLGDLFYEYEVERNPVTKSVLRQIIQERLNVMNVI